MLKIYCQTIQSKQARKPLSYNTQIHRLTDGGEELLAKLCWVVKKPWCDKSSPIYQHIMNRCPVSALALWGPGAKVLKKWIMKKPRNLREWVWLNQMCFVTHDITWEKVQETRKERNVPHSLFLSKWSMFAKQMFSKMQCVWSA